MDENIPENYQAELNHRYGEDNDAWDEVLCERAVELGLDPTEYKNPEELEEAIKSAVAEEFDEDPKPSTADNIMNYVINGK